MADGHGSGNSGNKGDNGGKGKGKDKGESVMDQIAQFIRHMQEVVENNDERTAEVLLTEVLLREEIEQFARSCGTTLSTWRRSCRTTSSTARARAVPRAAATRWTY